MRRLPVGLLLFLVFQGLYGLTASGRVERVPDEYEVYFQVESLAQRGSLALPPFVEQGLFFGRVGRDGQKFAPYGPGMAFAALPHHLVGRGIAGWLGLPAPRTGDGFYTPAGPSWLAVVAAITSLATSTWAALLVVGVFAGCRALGSSEARAAWVAGTVGVASLVFPYGTLFFSEPVAAALLVWAVVFHLRGKVWLAAPLMTALCLIKATNLVLGPALLLLALAQTDRQRRLRDAMFYGVALAAAALIHMSWNRYRFGNPLEFGYDWGETIVGNPRPFDPAGLPRGLFGLLLSPGKSLFLFAPLLLLAVSPARARRLRQLRPDLAACLGAVVASLLLFYGSYMFWEGGYCPGPRHLLPLVPLLALPLAVGPPPGRTAGRACLVVGAGLSLLLSSVSYLEDQAIGAEALTGGPRREVYYQLDPDPPLGRPANVYRLGYSPALSYPPRLWGHLSRPATGVGEGLEFMRAHLLRVRRHVPGGRQIPAWLPWALSLPFLIPLGLGLQGLWPVRDRANRAD